MKLYKQLLRELRSLKYINYYLGKLKQYLKTSPIMILDNFLWMHSSLVCSNYGNCMTFFSLHYACSLYKINKDCSNENEYKEWLKLLVLAS